MLLSMAPEALLFQPFAHPLRNHGRIVGESKRHGTLESLRACGTPLMSKMVSGIAIIVPIMTARVTLKAVNDELARRGHHARLEKASGYFYFWSEDSVDWLDRTVRVATLKSLTLDQWVGEYLWLKKVNAEMIEPRRKGPWINR